MCLSFFIYIFLYNQKSYQLNNQPNMCFCFSHFNMLHEGVGCRRETDARMIISAKITKKLL